MHNPPPNAPPSGTVTFLFTDIEGSTKRWEVHPQQMQRAVERHDAILRRSIEAHGGYIFKTVGDAFCSAFATPLFALDAVLSLQRALASEQWDSGTTGEPCGCVQLCIPVLPRSETGTTSASLSTAWLAFSPPDMVGKPSFRWLPRNW